MNPTVAYVLPMALFLALGALEGWAPLAKYYPGLYSAKIAAVTVTWWLLRGQYPRFRREGLLRGLLAGAVGAAVWIALAELRLERFLQPVVPGWLLPGGRSGYNPFDAIAEPVWQWAFVAVRLFGLVVTISLVEEVFWRGFLLRYLIEPDFRSVSFSRFTPLSFAGVTLLFAAAHPELLAAVAWCAGVNLLLYWTGNLWSCVICHSVTNLLLAVYILQSGAWHLW